MRFQFTLFAVALASQATWPRPSHAANWSVKKVTVVPTPCDFKDCWAAGQHGDVRVVYRDGRTVKVTQNGDAKDAKISPDGRTLGWTVGKHQPCTDWSVGGTMFVNSQLVLFRNGKKLRILQTPGTFIENWRFWNDGKYVAIGSRWHHGVGYCRLFDVKSGKLLERLTTPEAETKKLKWAKDLTA